MGFVDGELKRAQIESVSTSSPTPAVRGRMVLDTSAFGGALPVLMMHDGSNWRAISNGRTKMRSITANYTPDFQDEVIDCNASGGAFTITLPEGTGNIIGKKFWLRRNDQTLANKVTIQRGGSDTIESVTSLKLATQGEFICLVNFGSTWRIYYHYIPSHWTTFTPTGAWSANTTYTGRWRRVGDTIDMDIKVATTGAPTSASLYINMPTGLTIDSNKLIDAEAGISELGGEVSIRDAGTENYIGLIRYDSTGTIAIFKDDGDGTVSAVTQAAPMTWANGDKAVIRARGIPITDWSAWAA